MQEVYGSLPTLETPLWSTWTEGQRFKVFLWACHVVDVLGFTIPSGVAVIPAIGCLQVHFIGLLKLLIFQSIKTHDLWQFMLKSVSKSSSPLCVKDCHTASQGTMPDKSAAFCLLVPSWLLF